MKRKKTERPIQYIDHFVEKYTHTSSLRWFFPQFIAKTFSPPTTLRIYADKHHNHTTTLSKYFRWVFLVFFFFFVRRYFIGVNDDRPTNPFNVMTNIHRTICCVLCDVCVFEPAWTPLSRTHWQILVSSIFCIYSWIEIHFLWQNKREKKTHRFISLLSNNIPDFTWKKKQKICHRMGKKRNMSI